MGKRKQHFVPKFYLRAFSPNPRLIDLIHLPTGRLVRGATLKDQCYRHNFYGRDEVIENALMGLEAYMAPVITQIIRDRKLPGVDTRLYFELMFFLALQEYRTAAAADLIDKMAGMATMAILEEDPISEEHDLSELEIHLTNPIGLAMSMAKEVAPVLSVLTPHLIVTDGAQRFVTSDQPVFLYNTWCEDVEGMGVRGVNCSGIQVFYPLSPEVTLLLFDSEVYKSVRGRKKGGRISKASDSDVHMLNVAQAVSADRHIYFGPWLADAEARSMEADSRAVRETPLLGLNKADEVEAEEDSDRKSVLLHQYRRMPNLKMRLSFLRTKIHMRQVPLVERTRRFVVNLPDAPTPPRGPGGIKRTFMVRRPDEGR